MIDHLYYRLLHTAHEPPNNFLVLIPPIAQRTLELRIDGLQFHAGHRYAAILGSDGQCGRDGFGGEVGGDAEGEVGGIHLPATGERSWHVIEGSSA